MFRRRLFGGFLAILLLFMASLVFVLYKRQAVSRRRQLTVYYQEREHNDIYEELTTLAKSQIWPWKHAKFNKSYVRDFFDRTPHLYVVEIRNSSIQIPSYVDQHHTYKGNIKQFLYTLETLLKEHNDIQDTILFLNLLDEPRLPDCDHCSSSGVFKEIESFHGLPLSNLDCLKESVIFPILSTAKISPCFRDILFPFNELLDQNLLDSLAHVRQNVCQWEPQSRLKTALFRGSLTGHSVAENRNHRLKVARICDSNESRILREYLKEGNFSNLYAKFQDGPLCDAAFNEAFEWLPYVKDLTSPKFSIPMERWDEISYLVLDMDGSSYSRRLATLCFLDMNIIRVGMFDDVLLQLLRHGRDYYHVAPDLSDLFSSIEILRNNWNLSQQMCLNKFERCRRILTFEAMKYYTKVLLTLYSKYVQFV
ncbi:hypothetical protein GpartN1_g1771.t1 [Galdieria partita]|uniref:Glycosyl transferase CAP10 domain-containing protein n=1 Tax=Galdieria partita TaxID=83374 RepID=A0A9C7PT69_9RHOD|nr:hypothetical protein GpartN1_g1771.t1 [Galdieria partita]